MGNKSANWFKQPAKARNPLRRSHLRVGVTGLSGAGKTTFTRGIVQGFGHTGKVKSPTYTLVEPYELERANVYHFDLYRLGDPEELEYMGIRDYFSAQAICVVEWPEKGGEFIPVPDLNMTLSYVGDERNIVINSASERGSVIIEKLNNSTSE